MSSMQWIHFLLILGLLSYSYGYQRRNDHARRRVRDTSLKDAAQAAVNAVMGDETQLHTKFNAFMKRDEDLIQTVTQNIYVGLKAIAEAGTQDVNSVKQWVNIQKEIRRGINVIIDAYRRYIELHQETCKMIGDFVNIIITKYESEISALDLLTVPTLPDGEIDTGSSAYNNFTASLLAALRYAQFHQATLARALDCPADLTTRALLQRAATVPAVTHQITIRCHRHYPPLALMTKTTSLAVFQRLAITVAKAVRIVLSTEHEVY